MRERWWHGLTRYQWVVLLVAWLGWVFDLMDAAFFNFAKQPMLVEMLGGDAAYKAQGPWIEGFIQTVFFLGWALGGLVFGALADRVGRTRTMVYTILLYCLFTGLTALCTNWQQVAVARFLTAMGLGGEWAAGAALVAEVFPDKARAAAAGFLQTAAAFGPVLAAAANLVVPAADWRLLFVVGLAPALLTLWIRYGVHEPERWVASAKAPPRGSPIRELFTHPVYRRHALVAIVLGTVVVAGAMNISYWHPNLVAAASEGLSADVIKDRKSIATFTLHAGTLLGVLFVPWLCERMGRRSALLTFFLGGAASIFVTAYGATTYERILFFGPLMTFFSIGVSGALVLYFPELFPTRLRATGAGFGYNSARVFAAPIPFITGALIGTMGITGGVIAIGLVLYSLGILVLPFAPETRNRPLPEN